MTNEIDAIRGSARQLSRDPAATTHDLRGAVKGLLNLSDADAKIIAEQREALRKAALFVEHAIATKNTFRIGELLLVEIRASLSKPEKI